MTTVMTGTIVTTTAHFVRKLLGDETLQPAAPGTAGTFALMCLYSAGCLSGALLAHSAWPLTLLSLLIAYVVIVNFIYFDFWRHEGDEAIMLRKEFLRNLSVVGGLVACLMVPGT